MRLFVGVTDGEGFRHLAAIPAIDEASFRQPSGSDRAPPAGGGRPGQGTRPDVLVALDARRYTPVS